MQCAVPGSVRRAGEVSCASGRHGLAGPCPARPRKLASAAWLADDVIARARGGVRSCRGAQPRCQRGAHSAAGTTRYAAWHVSGAAWPGRGTSRSHTQGHPRRCWRRMWLCRRFTPSGRLPCRAPRGCEPGSTRQSPSKSRNCQRRPITKRAARGCCGQIADELARGPVQGFARIRQVLAEVADGVRSAAEGELRSLIRRERLLVPQSAVRRPGVPDQPGRLVAGGWRGRRG